MSSSTEAIDVAMEALAEGAPRTGRSVRGLSRWAHNPRCGVNNLAFAARVDLDKLLAGTEWAAPYGEGPFARRRGSRVEELARRDNYAAMSRVLREALGPPIDEVVARNLRRGFARGNEGLKKRAVATREALAAMLAGDPDAPNILDGAVLAAHIGGYAAHLETDGIGARHGPVLHVTELKGWPKVDGKADDATKMGEAKRQMGVYAHLLGGIIDDLGGDPAVVLGREGVLVTPQNVGMTLVGTKVPLDQPMRTAEILLRSVPDPADFAGEVRAPGGLGPAGNPSSPEEGRANHFSVVAEEVGTHFQDSCLSSCGAYRLCRELRGEAGDPALCGSGTVRFLPGVRTLARAAELADGAAATADEGDTGVADQLALAGRLYRERSVAVPAVRALAAAPAGTAGR